MDEAALLVQLENLAEFLGIQVRSEPLEEGEASFFPGGLCRLKDRTVFIFNARATTSQKVQALARVLRRYDLSRIYLRPAIRDFLEGARQNDDGDTMN